MKVVIEYLVLHEVLQSVHLWHSTMKYMPKFVIKETKKKDPHFAVHLPQVDLTG